jgi:hypothetical protein
LINSIAEFLQKVLPRHTSLQKTVPKIESTKISDVQTHLSEAAASDIIYETPKRPVNTSETEEEEEEESESDISQEHLQRYGEIASPYITPYQTNKPYLDRVFGIRKESDGQLRIGNSLLKIDNDSNITIQGETFKGTKCLFELLTRKKVNHSLITTDDLKI